MAAFTTRHDKTVWLIEQAKKQGWRLDSFCDALCESAEVATRLVAGVFELEDLAEKDVLFWPCGYAPSGAPCVILLTNLGSPGACALYAGGYEIRPYVHITKNTPAEKLTIYDTALAERAEHAMSLERGTRAFGAVKGGGVMLCVVVDNQHVQFEPGGPAVAWASMFKTLRRIDNRDVAFDQMFGQRDPSFAKYYGMLGALARVQRKANKQKSSGKTIPSAALGPRTVYLPGDVPPAPATPSSTLKTASLSIPDRASSIRIAAQAFCDEMMRQTGTSRDIKFVVEDLETALERGVTLDNEMRRLFAEKKMTLDAHFRFTS